MKRLSKIRTNDRGRDLISWDELPLAAQQEFDWEEAREDVYFCYKGIYYNVGNAVRIEKPGHYSSNPFTIKVELDDPLAVWDGAYTSGEGLVIRFINDHEQVVVGQILV